MHENKRTSCLKATHQVEKGREKEKKRNKKEEFWELGFARNDWLMTALSQPDSGECYIYMYVL